MRVKLNDHFPAWLENTILIVILLVVVHTLVEDIIIIRHGSPQAMKVLAIFGFIFDLFFTAEFTGRSVISHRRGQLRQYLLHQRGYIDFISSVPLLLLVSLPNLVYYLAHSPVSGVGVGFLSILKTAKAIRVTRVLRLIRVVKIFGKIQNTESEMTNRHVGIVATLSVLVLVSVLIVTHLIPSLNPSDPASYLRERLADVSALTAQAARMPEESMLADLIRNSPSHEDVIELKSADGRIIFSHPNKADLMWNTIQSGREHRVAGGYTVVLGAHRLDEHDAQANLVMFLAILALILVLMFVYSPIFAKSVSDPAYVMERGLNEWDYNLEVSVPQAEAQDEIFRLAGAFNRRWLPLKAQIRDYRKKKQPEKSSLRIEDVF